MKLLGSLLLAALLLLVYPNPANATPVRGATIFQEINAKRIENHLPALRVSPALVLAAQAKANDMARRGYFAHRTPDGKNMTAFVKGYRYSVLGENLATGFSESEALTSAWMVSPTHRENILFRDFLDTGIGIASDGKNLFIVQYFGRSLGR